MPEILFGDFETRSPVGIKKSGADVYARNKDARVMAFGYAFDDDEVIVSKMGCPPEPAVIDHIAAGKILVAHNAPFELVIWNYVFRREFPWLPRLKPEQVVCTMALCYAMGLPGALEKAAAALGLDIQKDLQGQRIMIQLATPKEDNTNIFWEPNEVPEKFSRMYKYCGVDVDVERLIFKRAMRLSPKETLVWILDQKINQRGVSVDLKAAESAIKLVALEKKRLDDEMQIVTKGRVPSCSAVKDLTDWLKDCGLDVDGVAKNDVADLLSLEDLPSDCRRALELRQEAAKSSNAKLPRIIGGACDDGRVRGLFQYHGAGTGRWAGRRIQLQNLPRSKIKQKQIDEVFGILRSIN